METDITVRYELYSQDNIPLEDCLLYCKLLTEDYIWQKEWFDLLPNHHVSGLFCLSGSANVGENILDEWIIVFLLFELTKKYTNLVAHVSDDDGEFLLIQAAEELPTWLSPESCENRIFISQGRLHIIPSKNPLNDSTIMPFVATPSVQEAYDTVMSSFSTLAKDEIQNAIMQKISAYPQKIKNHIQFAHCYIPYEIAFILKKKPNLVSKAVQAFYERDPSDAKICQNLSIFKPDNRLLTLVKFSKHLYGQLYQANIHPNKESKWKLPTVNSSDYKSSYLGYKLTCGFELLIGQHRNVEKKLLNPSGKSWEQYLSNLKRYDYFSGEKEGSKKYQTLLKQAKECFFEGFSSSNKVEIEEEMIKLYEEALKNDHEELYTELPKEDSDAWLTVSPEEFDQLMMNAYTNGAKENENLLDLSSKVKGFIDNVSSYEGAESFSDTNENTKILFDQEQFMSCLGRLLISSDNISGEQNSDDDNVDVDDDDEDGNEFLSCYKESCGDENELSNMFQRLGSELKESTLNINNDQKDDTPLDLDINVIQNFYESFSSQTGLSGPVSSILHSVGKVQLS